MLANYGFFLIFLCFICSLYGFISAMLAAYWRHKRLYLSSKMAMTVTCALVVSASALLVYGFFQRDYSILYVAKTSSNDLPTFFTFAAFWSSLEGSHTM